MIPDVKFDNFDHILAQISRHLEVASQTDVVLAGRCITTKLTSGLILKLSLETAGTHSKFERLAVKVINSQEGVVDSISLKFSHDLETEAADKEKGCTGVSSVPSVSTQYHPYIWENSGKVYWYRRPTWASLALMMGKVNAWVKLFE